MKGEYGEIMSTGASEIFWSNKELFFASAFLGIVVNLASFLVVRRERERERERERNAKNPATIPPVLF